MLIITPFIFLFWLYFSSFLSSSADYLRWWLFSDYFRFLSLISLIDWCHFLITLFHYLRFRLIADDIFDAISPLRCRFDYLLDLFLLMLSPPPPFSIFRRVIDWCHAARFCYYITPLFTLLFSVSLLSFRYYYDIISCWYYLFSRYWFSSSTPLFHFLMSFTPFFITVIWPRSLAHHDITLISDFIYFRRHYFLSFFFSSSFQIFFFFFFIFLLFSLAFIVISDDFLLLFLSYATLHTHTYAITLIFGFISSRFHAIFISSSTSSRHWLLLFSFFFSMPCWYYYAIDWCHYYAIILLFIYFIFIIIDYADIYYFNIDYASRHFRHYIDITIIDCFIFIIISSPFWLFSYYFLSYCCFLFMLLFAWCRWCYAPIFLSTMLSYYAIIFARFHTFAIHACFSPIHFRYATSLHYAPPPLRLRCR